MSRRGAAEMSINMLVGVVIALVLLGLGLFFLFRGAQQFKEGASCGYGAGVCKEVCNQAAGERWALEGMFGCAPPTHCCKMINGSAPAPDKTGGTTSSGTSSGTTAAKPLPALRAPTIRGRDNLSQQIPTKTELAAFVQQPRTIVVYGNVSYHKTACPAVGPLQQGAVCIGNANGGRWKAKVIVEQRGSVLYQSEEWTVGTVQGTRIGGTEQLVDVSFTNTPELLINNISDGTAFMPYRIDIRPNFPEKFAGQKLHMIVYVYLDSLGRYPEYERIYEVYYKVSNPLQVTGVTQQWSTKKTIQVSCKPPLSCTDVYFSLRDQEEACLSNADRTLFNEKDVLAEPRDFYCVVTGRTESDDCHPTLEECQNKIGLASSISEYRPVISRIASSTGTQDAQKLGDLFLTAQNDVDVPSCKAYSIIPDLSASQAYRVTTFDPKSQQATFTIGQGVASGKYLCVYGKDVAGNIYYSSPEQKLNIDVRPPEVKAKFDWYNLRVQVSCNDGNSPADSGCKQTFGVAYISDATKFLPALGSGPKSAELYCPPPKSGAYAPETRNRWPYLEAEVRVLCVRAEDNAGNAAVTMITLYNSYDVLAKTLVLATQ